jgi:hypothetical protein
MSFGRAFIGDVNRERNVITNRCVVLPLEGQGARGRRELREVIDSGRREYHEFLFQKGV